MNGKEVLFLIFAGITVGSAALVVFSKRITYAAFALMFSFSALQDFIYFSAPISSLRSSLSFMWAVY